MGTTEPEGKLRIGGPKILLMPLGRTHSTAHLVLNSGLGS